MPIGLTLVEEFRPITWDGVYGIEYIKTVLKRMIENDTTQHMMFIGPPGCGKTTIARIFAAQYLGIGIEELLDADDYRELNASDERGIAVITGRKVKKFCQLRSKQPGKKRVLFLDEADNLTPDAQRALRAIMENNQSKVIIIMSLNHKERIKEDALLSRVAMFEFDPANTDYLKQCFIEAASAKGIEFDVSFPIDSVVSYPPYDGDFRKILNDTLQKLLGIGRPVKYEDVPWIHRKTYTQLIDKIIDDRNRAWPIFWAEYKTQYIDCVLFISQLFDKYQSKFKISFDLANIFGQTEMNIKNGGDEMTQMCCLLTAIEADL